MVKILSRDAINRMVGRKSSVAGVGGGGGDVDLSGYATKIWTQETFVSIDFFRSLFRAYDSQNHEILPNDTTSTIDNIKAMFGFWTEQYLSALGQGSGGGGGGASALSDLLDVQLTNPTNGQALIYNSTLSKWVNRTVGGTDMATVWNALSVGTSEQINVSHLTNALSGYVTTSAISDMATKTWVGQQSYATQTWVTNNFLTQTAASETYLSKNDAASTYLTQTAASATYLTQTAAATTYLSIAFFDRLFQAYEGTGSSATRVNPNDTTSTIDNIKAMFGFWTEQYISALGQGAGGGTILTEPLQSINNAGLGTPQTAGVGLVWDGTAWTYGNTGGGSGDVTWTALAAATNEQINVTHLSTALSGYALTSQLSNYLPLTGGTVTGQTAFNTSASSDTPVYLQGNSAKTFLGFRNSVGTILGYLALDSSNAYHHYGGTSYKLWDSGNDGSGSGLDADLLDGQHGSYYAVNSEVVKLSSSSCQLITRTNGDTPLSLKGSTTDTYLGFVDKNGTTLGHYAVKSDHQPYFYYNGSSYKLWDSGNDGSGSGLDADLLDGQHGSYYAAASSLNNYLPLTGGTVTGNIIISGNDNAFVVKSSSNNEDIWFGNSSSAYIWGTVNGSYLRFNNGKVGVATVPSGSYLLEVNGTLFSASETTLYTNFKFEHTNELNNYYSNGAGAFCLNYRVSGDVRVCYGGGRFAIGGSAVLEFVNGTVKGNLRMKTNNEFYFYKGTDGSSSSDSAWVDAYGFYAYGPVTALSDERDKNVVGNVGLSVEQIADAPAVRFLWKDGRADNSMQTGSIAQYWQKVLPEVIREKEDRLSLSYGVAGLVSAIVTARKVVDHEKRIQELERENKELKLKLKIA